MAEPNGDFPQRPPSARKPGARLTSTSRCWLVMVVLAGAEFLLVLDFSMATIALPHINATFHLDHAQLQWVMTAFAVPYGGCMLVGGRVGERFEHRQVLEAGLVCFAGGALLAGLAPTYAVLVSARVVQGVAGAAAVPAAFALATTVFRSETERRRALTVTGAALSAGELCGLLFGAVVVIVLGWRSVFLADVPIAVGLAVAARILLPGTSPRADAVTVNVLGAALITASAAGCVYVTVLLTMAPLPRAFVAATSVTVLLLLLAFRRVERLSRAPLVPPEMLGNAQVRHGTLAAGVASGIVGGLTYLLSVYFQDTLRYAPLHCALLLSAFGVAAVAVGAFVQKAVCALGVANVLRAAAFADSAGALLISAALITHSTVGVLAGLAALGAGFTPLLVAGMLTATTRGSSDGDADLPGVFNAFVELASGVGLAFLSFVASPFSSKGAMSFTDGGIGVAALAGAAMMLFVGLSGQRAQTVGAS